jgi:hypothetical protein
VVGEVAVGVDAVADLGLSVSVVVAEVLPPQPLVVERVLVAIGVGHEDEPELGRLQKLADLTVVGPPPVDVVVHQPPVDLGGDPFTRVLGGAVEDGRTRAVRLLLSALGQLDRDDLATLAGVAEDLELHQLGVVAGRGVELVADAAGLVVRAPDVEAAGGLLRRELLDGLAALDPGQLQVDSSAPKPVGLGLVEDQVELDATPDPSLAAHFDALLGDRGNLIGLDHCGVGVQPIRVSTCARCGRRGRKPHAESGDYRCDQ